MKTQSSLYLLVMVSMVTIQAQTITNVQARQEGFSIIITYDMSGSLKQSNKIEVSYSTDGGKNYSTISGVEGDVGSQATPGTGNEIYWSITDNTPSGTDLLFKVWVSTPSPPAMVYVDSGSFQMGSTTGDSDEKPVHSVTVKSFFMDKTEITQAEYRRVMGDNPSDFRDCDECPVENVSWDDATEYARKVGKRLPTEAEWEYAARGGNQSKGTSYSGSNNLNSVCWSWNNSEKKTQQVGQKQPNELGLYDMSGNVSEWCADWYSKDYYSHSPDLNPLGSASGSDRVLRGGSWFKGGIFSRVTNREKSNLTYRSNHQGFRCVQDLK